MRTPLVGLRWGQNGAVGGQGQSLTVPETLCSELAPSNAVRNQEFQRVKGGTQHQGCQDTR
jgi:hypothetical protein